jgi:DNA-binding CsgD family transcriptional regulator
MFSSKGYYDYTSYPHRRVHAEQELYSQNIRSIFGSAMLELPDRTIQGATMTSVVFIIDPAFHATWTYEDPRTAREIMVAVNTRKDTLKPTALDLSGERQWAHVHTSIETVTVVLQAPPVELTPRQYEVLFGLAESKPAAEIAGELGISRRMVYQYTRELKERFERNTVPELLARAVELGMIEEGPL